MSSLLSSTTNEGSINADAGARRDQHDGRPTGRRSFLGYGVAAGVIALSPREASADGRGRRARRQHAQHETQSAVASPDCATAKTASANYLPSLYPGENRIELAQIQSDENNHRAFLLSLLGSNARPEPTFQGFHMANLLSFIQTAMALENTGTGAYLGAAPYFYNPQYLAAAASILPIEARHASYLNVLLNHNIILNSLDEVPENGLEVALTQQQVVADASPFIVSLNGGPPLAFSTTPSPENDIAILNFALALEYLESTFYNLNVPRFLS